MSKTIPQKTDRKPWLEAPLPYLLMIGGMIGIICSFVISQDKIELLKNPGFTPSCDLNPVISCGSVMKSVQGSVFGFPNPWIGLAAFAVFVTIGVSMIAGAKYKRWFWLAFEGGTLLGLTFAYWLLFESVYRIKALCPYCLAVDVVLITTAWYLTLYSIGAGYATVPARLKPVVGFARRHHAEILVTWFLILIALILQHFWYYYGQFI